MKIKNNIYWILFWFAFSSNIYSQAEISTQDCNSITATVNTFSEVTSIDFSFVLEKEIIKDVWKKTATKTNKNKTCSFEVLDSGVYRVSIIPSNVNSIEKTRIYVFGSKKDALANLYVSNSLDIKIPCDERPKETQIENRIDGILIFPNPARSEISLFFPFENTGTIEMYDTAGRLVKNVQLKPLNNTVDIKGLQSGLYCTKPKGN